MWCSVLSTKCRCPGMLKGSGWMVLEDVVDRHEDGVGEIGGVASCRSGWLFLSMLTG